MKHRITKLGIGKLKSRKDVDKLRTGDRRVDELDFYNKLPVPITYIPRP